MEDWLALNVDATPIRSHLNRWRYETVKRDRSAGGIAEAVQKPAFGVAETAICPFVPMGRSYSGALGEGAKRIWR